MKPISFVCVIALAALAGGCVGEQEQPAASRAESETAVEEPSVGSASGFALTSSAFEPNGMIPAMYTCDGENVSPPLAWGDPPEGTESFALIMDDPDAAEVAGKVWVHWLLYNLPGDARSLPEGAGRGLGRVGGPEEGADDGTTALPLHGQHHNGGQADEAKQWLVEVLTPVHGVKGLGLLLGDLKHLEGHYL